MLGSELKGFKGINKSYSGNFFSPLFVKVKASIEGRVCISTTVKVGNMKNGPFLAATSSSRRGSVRFSVLPCVTVLHPIDLKGPERVKEG